MRSGIRSFQSDFPAGTSENEDITIHARDFLNSVHRIGEEWVRKVGHDHSDRCGSLCLKSPSQFVRPIAEPLHDIPDFLCLFLADVFRSIQNAGGCFERDAGFASNVDQCGDLRLFQHHVFAHPVNKLVRANSHPLFQVQQSSQGLFPWFPDTKEARHQSAEPSSRRKSKRHDPMKRAA